MLWIVENPDGTDSQRVWWPCTIGADEEGQAGGARLSYVAMPAHGFDEEARRVVFLAGSYVWDAPTRERLPYRREGEAGPPLETEEEAEEDAQGAEDNADGGDAPAGTLAVGTAVKSRFQGGDKFCAGVIHAANVDGTYDVYYDDHVLEEVHSPYRLWSHRSHPPYRPWSHRSHPPYRPWSHVPCPRLTTLTMCVPYRASHGK